MDDAFCGRVHGLLLVTLGAVVIAFGCGGDGDGGGGVTPPSLCVQFAASESPGAGKVAARAVGGSACEVTSVECVVTNQADVFSAGFTVTYPSSVVDYLGYSLNGSFLSSDGARVDVLEQKEPGRATIGISRVGVANGISVTGSAVLITLRFGKRGTTASSGTLAFENGKLLGSEEPPKEKPNIRWTGGTIRLN